MPAVAKPTNEGKSERQVYAAKDTEEEDAKIIYVKSKYCTACKEWLPISQFRNTKQTRCGKTARCKFCHSKYFREYYRNNIHLWEEKYVTNKKK